MTKTGSLNSMMSTLQQRRAFFRDNFPPLSPVFTGKDKVIHLDNTCPACGYLTLDSRNNFEICSICFWEDDGQDNTEADEVWGGPNGGHSLTSWRAKTSAMLADLYGNSAALHPVEQEAGAALQRIDDLIDRYNARNRQRVLDQLQAAMLLFDDLRTLPHRQI